MDTISQSSIRSILYSDSEHNTANLWSSQATISPEWGDKHGPEMGWAEWKLKPNHRLFALFTNKSFITDRVRSTRGGYIFSLCVCLHPGGVSRPADGGRGTPSSWWWGGVPHPTDGGGGGPAPGTPPAGGPRPGYPPPHQEQHSVYLLRGGRYASCVHAGGLSCFISFSFTPFSHACSGSQTTHVGPHCMDCARL